MPIERTAPVRYSRRRCSFPLCRRPASRPDNPGCTSGPALVPWPKLSRSPKLPGPKCASEHPYGRARCSTLSRERFLELAKASSLGNVIFCAAANPVGLVQKEFSVAERRFGILVGSHNDCLDVVVIVENSIRLVSAVESGDALG
jgi:hypothetical protein